MFCPWDWELINILNLQWSEKEKVSIRNVINQTNEKYSEEENNFMLNKIKRWTNVKNSLTRIQQIRPLKPRKKKPIPPKGSVSQCYPLSCCTESRPLLARVLRAVRAALLWLPSRVPPAPWLTWNRQTMIISFYLTTTELENRELERIVCWCFLSMKNRTAVVTHWSCCNMSSLVWI